MEAVHRQERDRAERWVVYEGRVGEWVFRYTFAAGAATRNQGKMRPVCEPTPRKDSPCDVKMKPGRTLLFKLRGFQVGNPAKPAGGICLTR